MNVQLIMVHDVDFVVVVVVDHCLLTMMMMMMLMMEVAAVVVAVVMVVEVEEVHLWWLVSLLFSMVLDLDSMNEMPVHQLS